MKKFLLVLLLVVAVAGVAAFAWVESELYRPHRGYTGSIILEVAPGTSAPELAKTLVDRGVLQDRLPFLVRYAVGRFRHRIKAGEYFFDRPLRPIDVYEKFIRGEVYLHTVLVPEGSDRFDIAYILNRNLKMNGDAFLRVTQDSQLISDLDPQAPTLEGYLFPDTYRFPRNVSPATVVETMLARFHHVYNSNIKNELESAGASLHDVVTLASLVEKETPDRQERPVVAGVFTRRMQLGMPLACDPTVVYAARLDHRMLEHPAPPITRSELEFDSPYNTYRHAGLPPGPIANPGQASIRAALYPAPGKALYFVSNNHGGHVFANTLAEHERNVARYRKEVAENHSQERAQAAASGRPLPENAKTGGHAPATTTKGGQRDKQKTTYPRNKNRSGSRKGRAG